jgi:hypothetical protein
MKNITPLYDKHGKPIDNLFLTEWREHRARLFKAQRGSRNAHERWLHWARVTKDMQARSART